jgi:hypothetical protein
MDLLCVTMVVCFHPGLVFAGGYSFEMRELALAKTVQLDRVTFQCTDCAYQSNRRANVLRHVEGHHIANVSVSCPSCSQEFASTNALNTHMSRKHRNSK